MSELTLQRLSTMTKEEVRATPYAEIDKVFKVVVPGQPGWHPRNPDGLDLDAIHRRLSDMFKDDAEPHTQAFNAAYAADPTQLVPHLVEALVKEHGLVILRVWSQLTAAGVEDLPKAKWAHKHLARPILNVFYPEGMPAPAQP